MTQETGRIASGTAGSSEIPPPTPLTDGHVRLLKIAVVAMGLMIVAGIAAVIGRIIYLGSGGQKQATVSQSSSQVMRAGAGGRLGLPPQASIRHLSLSGDRLAVHYEGPTGAGIVVVDSASGAVLSRIELVPEVPR